MSEVIDCIVAHQPDVDWNAQGLTDFHFRWWPCPSCGERDVVASHFSTRFDGMRPPFDYPVTLEHDCWGCLGAVVGTYYAGEEPPFVQVGPPCGSEKYEAWRERAFARAAEIEQLCGVWCDTFWPYQEDA